MAPNCAAEDTHRYRSRDMNSLINTKGSRPMRTFPNGHPTHASNVYSTESHIMGMLAAYP